MRRIHLFLIFALLLFMLIGYKTYEQYERILKTQDLIIQNESRSLGNFIAAFRQTYQDIFLRHNIEVTDKTLHLLPVKTTREISERFSKSLQGDIVIRTVSDRPRNPENMANAFEMEMINYFKKHSEVKEKFTQLGSHYYYTKPLYVKASCLKCHGKREDTIPSIREKYNLAYDYKVGDLRGLVNISIKEHTFFNILYKDFRNTVIITVVIYIFFLTLIYFLLQKVQKHEERYRDHLEKEIRQKTSEIEKQKNTFVTLFEKSSDGILIMHRGKIIECNEKAVRMFGYTDKKTFLSQTIRSFAPRFQPDGQLSVRKVRQIVRLSQKHNGYQFEWQNKKADGEIFLGEVMLTPIILDNKKVLHIVIRDISEKKKAQEKLIEQKNILHYQAHHDALTGLPNRILFNDRLEHGIERAKRQKSMLALLFVDLDHFKKINDSLGHHIGDKVLKVVAERLRMEVHQEDTLSRLGGDEFTIILEDIDKIQKVQKLAQKIEEVIAKPMRIEGHTLYISGSIGISIYPQDDIKPQNLLKYADAAMYRAKDEGRNNYQFYSKEMTTLAFQRLVMESNMRQALERDEFRIYYQPQFDARDGVIVGLEALIRWEHPTLGLLLPEKFIPLAEESDLIVEIDRWVMQTAMEHFSQWYGKGYIPGNLGLNLSMRQLGSSDFMEILEQSMHKTGFKSVWLELEVTESQVMQKPEESIEKLKALNDMGIKIAIDDFGTGYSSLAYLKRLPVSRLKIDRSFIRDIPENKEDVAIVKAIIALAKSLGIGIIAEGVESEVQSSFLMKNHCYMMQGYYYGRPVISEKIEELFLLGKQS
jgi:diguanylate cyclase (GGDEF)-like protein/PAS domain S-box-containing protein